MKLCNTCTQDKPLDAFRRCGNGGKMSAAHSTCNACHRRLFPWLHEHPEFTPVMRPKPKERRRITDWGGVLEWGMKRRMKG